MYIVGCVAKNRHGRQGESTCLRSDINHVPSSAGAHDTHAVDLSQEWDVDHGQALADGCTTSDALFFMPYGGQVRGKIVCFKDALSVTPFYHEGCIIRHSFLS